MTLDKTKINEAMDEFVKTSGNAATFKDFFDYAASKGLVENSKKGFQNVINKGGF